MEKKSRTGDSVFLKLTTDVFNHENGIYLIGVYIECTG